MNMAPTRVIGVRRQFFRARSTMPFGQAKGLENLDSDPKNHLPPEGAVRALGRPGVARFATGSTL